MRREQSGQWSVSVSIGTGAFKYGCGPIVRFQCARSRNEQNFRLHRVEGFEPEEQTGLGNGDLLGSTVPGTWQGATEEEDCIVFSAEISWNHAKKKDSQANGHTQLGGQGAPPAHNEEGSGDKAPEEEVIATYCEILLNNQANELQCLSAIQATLDLMAASLKVLSEWAETNWTETRVRGPKI